MRVLLGSGVYMNTEKHGCSYFPACMTKMTESQFPVPVSDFIHLIFSQYKPQIF